MASPVLWTCPTARKRTCWDFLSRTGSGTLHQSLPSSPGFRTWSLCTCCRSLTPGSWTGTRAIAPAHVAFPSARRGRHSQTVISELNTAPMRSPANASPRHHWASTHSSGPERIATPYSVVDFHHLLHAGFCRRFPNVPLYVPLRQILAQRKKRRLKPMNWEQRRKAAGNRKPLSCPRCGHTMELWCLLFGPHKYIAQMMGIKSDERIATGTLLTRNQVLSQTLAA